MEFDLKFEKKKNKSFKAHYLWNVKILHILSGKTMWLSSQCKWRINTSID